MKKIFETRSFNPGSTPNTDLLRDCGMFIPPILQLIPGKLLEEMVLNGDFLEAVLATLSTDSVKRSTIQVRSEVGYLVRKTYPYGLAHRSACWSSLII